MNAKELAVIELLRKNPFLTQQEMADALQMSRPALANLISGLMKAGKITGRAYILADEKEVVCIGGANVDRKYHLKEKAQLGTSNPANLTVSVGGVARNIAENLGRLSHPVRLLTVAGNDADWEAIVQSSSMHMSISDVNMMNSYSTGSYSAVLNPDGELIVAMANMDVYEKLSVEYMKEKERIMMNAAAIIIDLNCPKETVEYVKSFSQRYSIPFVIIPVSSPKMSHLPDHLTGVTWFICNRDEAEVYTNKPIKTDEDWRNAVKSIMDCGVENVIVTAGSKGAMAATKNSEVIHFPAVEGVSVEDVTGAGDAFVSGVLHGYLLNMDWQQSIKAGLVNAAKTLESNDTVRQDLTAEQLEKELEALQ